MSAPVYFEWDGEVMKPWPRFHNVVNAEYVVGQSYPLVTVEHRSQASHNHYFARLTDLWANLPERIAVQFPSEDHLRAHALCMTGYRNERQFVCSSNAEALRLAAFLRPVNEYAIISVAGHAVVEWTAQSQSKKAMGKDRFQKSKDDVLNYVEDLIGVKAEAAA